MQVESAFKANIVIDGVDLTGGTVTIQTTDIGDFVEGDAIDISGVVGTTELNALTNIYVGTVTGDDFILVDADGEEIDGTAFTPYVSDGLVTCIDPSGNLIVSASKFNVLVVFNDSDTDSIVTLERSFDNAENFYKYADYDSNDASLVNVIIEEPERGVLWRLSRTEAAAYDVNYRLGVRD